MKRNFYKICFVVFLALSMFSATATADEFTRGLLSETLDNLEKLSAANPWLPPDIQLQIEEARQALSLSTSTEVGGLPSSDFYNRLMLLEMSTRQLALLYEPALQAQSMGAQGERMKHLPTPGFTAQAYQGYVAGALDDPAYPSINWSFGWNEVLMPDTGDGTGNASAQEGLCAAPGYAVSDRFATLSVAVAAQAIQDITSRFCSETIAGFNGSLVCVVVDVAANIVKGINTFQETCNAYMTAAEVSAIWAGLKTVHGNVQHVYDDVAAHDSDIKGLLGQVLQNQTRMQGDLQTVIRLLNTPSGLRPDWPVKR